MDVGNCVPYLVEKTNGQQLSSCMYGIGKLSKLQMNWHQCMQTENRNIRTTSKYWLNCRDLHLSAYIYTKCATIIVVLRFHHYSCVP